MENPSTWSPLVEGLLLRIGRIITLAVVIISLAGCSSSSSDYKYKPSPTQLKYTIQYIHDEGKGLCYAVIGVRYDLLGFTTVPCDTLKNEWGEMPR